MTERTRARLVPCAFAACAALAFAFAGCSREEEPRPSAGPAEGAAQGTEAAAPIAPRLADPDYKAALGRESSSRRELLEVRDMLAATMRGHVNSVRARLGEADDAAIAAELAKDPEWAGLSARLADLNKALEDSRRHSAALVREKIFSEIRESNLK